MRLNVVIRAARDEIMATLVRQISPLPESLAACYQRIDVKIRPREDIHPSVEQRP